MIHYWGNNTNTEIPHQIFVVVEAVGHKQASVVPSYYAYITFGLYTVLCSYFFNHSIIPYIFPKVI